MASNRAGSFKDRTRVQFSWTERTTTEESCSVETLRWPCVVVRDRVLQNGILPERTTDWYAQTERGTVWYFGERTALLNRRGNVVSREGSFRSGRDGAEAGIFMPAHPMVGQSFKQEDYLGNAEDRFKILDLNAHVLRPGGRVRPPCSRKRPRASSPAFATTSTTSGTSERSVRSPSKAATRA